MVWRIYIEGPHGLHGQLVAADDGELCERFTKFVADCREHDRAPDGPEITGPAATQPRKEPSR